MCEKIWEVVDENADSSAKFQEDAVMTGINQAIGLAVMTFL